MPDGASSRLDLVTVWFTRLRRRPRLLTAGAVAAAMLVAAPAFLGRSVDRAMTGTVTRGDITARVATSGVLKPAQSITYRSPLAGREAEIVVLADEGTRVDEGDLLVRIDTTEVERELRRAVQEQRKSILDVQVAEGELGEAKAFVRSLTSGEGALDVAELQTRLRFAEREVERLRADIDDLEPLLEKGFITRDELEASTLALEKAEADLALLKRRAEVTTGQERPWEEQRARLKVEQREAALADARARAVEAGERVGSLEAMRAACSIYARAPGIVVYEVNRAVSPPRKIRVGDRVTATQGLVTIPEVDRMLVESSVAETQVHRVRPGLEARVRLDAFPDLELAGRVARVGTLARSSEQGFEAKRFDLLVELDRSEAELRPEMTARVSIVAEERRGVLRAPLNAIFFRDDVPIAHVVRRLGVETRRLALGATDDAFAEVVSGLEEGDRLLLTDLASRGREELSNARGQSGARMMDRISRTGSREGLDPR